MSTVSSYFTSQVRMFLLSFHKTVRSVLVWIEPSPTVFHNKHTSMLEQKRKQTVGLGEELWHGVSDNERLLRQYLADTYPVYFGLEPFSEKAHRLSNHMRYERW